jgi:hypothetical protein
VIVCPEKQVPAREKCSFVDFGGGDWCSRPLSGLPVAGEAKARHNNFLCCLRSVEVRSVPGCPVGNAIDIIMATINTTLLC